MAGKGLLRKALWRMEDSFVQWLWFLTTVDKGRIGYGEGPLTWLRTSGHRALRKRIHICLIDIHPCAGKFGRFTSFWINEKSRICSASVNEGIEDADVVWTYSQDPLTDTGKREIGELLGRKKPGAMMINHPDKYNAYHEAACFEALGKAGVSVPRSEFSDSEIGKTKVVYKAIGKHGAPSLLSPYRGPIEGFRAFEFCDSRRSDGTYRKYRAFHILGAVIARHILMSDKWNVHRETSTAAAYGFEVSEVEIGMIRLIAQTLGLEYFAVDFLRRSSDGFPVFTDINVYPLLMELSENTRRHGFLGRWTIFDVTFLSGRREISGRSFWDSFDEAMTLFVTKKDVPVSGASGAGLM